jgi:hypothetical protein
MARRFALSRVASLKAKQGALSRTSKRLAALVRRCTPRR